MHEDRQAPARATDNPPADPRHADASQALGAGARVDRFDIVDLIGAGASGFVYLAFDHALGRHVALREYLPRRIALRGPHGIAQPATPQQAGLFAAGLRSFASEALVLARIESPSLAKVLRYWEGNGTGYAVMPFYEGMTLRRAAHERRLAVDDVMLRALLAQLLDAVEAVHRAQSCHGNISPSDILIRADGRPLLLEFDAARTVLAEMTDTVPAMLKAGFAPVELYPGMKDMLPGAWSDIYALGAVAWFMITGKVPPSAPDRLRHDDMRSAREAGHGKFSPGLLDAIDRALSVRLEQRPASAAAMRELLGAGRALPAYAARADQGRDAIRRDRETMATRTAVPTDAVEAPAVPKAPRAPQPATVTAPAPAAPAPARPEPLPAELPPIQGEWRKLPMVAERREIPRRRSRLPALLLGAATLCTGVAAGVLIGYPELILPARDNPVAAAPAAPDVAGAADRTANPSSSPVPSLQASAPPPAPATQPAAPQGERARPPQPTPSARQPESAPASPPARKTTAVNEPEQNPEQAAPAAEEEEWRVASSIDQPEFYANYLKRFPDGPNAATARARLAADRQDRNASAPARAADRTAASPSAAPVEERSARAPTVNVARLPDAPRYSPEAMSATPRSDAGGSDSRRTIRSEGQTLTGDFRADPDTGILSGNGQVIWANGDRFEGNLVNGSKEGKGQYVWRNGQQYSGDWSNNQPNGRGAIVFADGNRYEGEIRNGVPNGRGVLAFKAGGRYDGDVRNGVPNGRGLMVFADGTRYEGEVRDGLPHGQGVTRFRNGDVYSGTLVKGVSHGQGRFSWANGLVWEGEFRDGLRTNNGRLIGQARTVASSGSAPASVGGAGE